jgi:hypothetical protein
MGLASADLNPKASLIGQPEGRIFLEFYIPRMGKRADAVLISGNIIFVGGRERVSGKCFSSS